MTHTGGFELLTATGNAPWESDLVARLAGRPDIRVARRCVDLADLLATAATAAVQAVVVGPDLHRLDRDAAARLGEHGLAVVGMTTATDSAGRARLEAIGIDLILDATVDPEQLSLAVGTGLARLRRPDTAPNGYAFDEDPDAPEGRAVVDVSGSVASGSLVAVWGPTGAPGRTTLASNVAVETARFGVPTLLADADTYGASVAQALGMLDEAPGLAAAVRRAASAATTPDEIARHARQLEPNLRVLTGLARADRWPELRPAALAAVWRSARELAALTIVDVGFSLEHDEHLTYDVSAPRRNAATIVTLEAADLVIVVGNADPVGVQRLIRGLDELRSTVPGCSILVAINRVRRGLPGGVREVGDLLHRHAAVDEIVPIPDDGPALDAAMFAGRPLADVAPRSPARTALNALAARVVRSTLPPGRRGDAGKTRSRGS